MAYTIEDDHRLPNHLQHTLPIFEPYFRQLSVLRIRNAGHTKSTFDILPNFFRLEELGLSSVDIPSYSINAGLPLFQTLRRLFLGSMTFPSMDGCVFTRLMRLYLDRVSFGKPLSVGLPVCTHINYVGDDYCPLQSIFRVPTLIEFIKDDAGFLGGDFYNLRLLPTRKLLLQHHLYTAPESLVAGIALLVELEVLNKFYFPYSTMDLLTALGRTIAEIGVPALRSVYGTLDRNIVVDDEYGEDAGALSRGPRSLICPNLRQFALRI